MEKIKTIYAPLMAYGSTKEEVTNYYNLIAKIEKHQINTIHDDKTGWQGDYHVAGYQLNKGIRAYISDDMEYGIPSTIEFYKEVA